MLDNFKWYRKLRGGVWCKYKRVTYSYHEGFGALPETEISWNRGGIDNSKGLLLKVENYENRR